MLVKYHIILGAIASFLIYLIFQITPIQATLIFLASFLIDFDHYLIYVIKKRDLNFNRACNWFLDRRKKWAQFTRKQKKEYKRVVIIFHGIEFILFLIILSFFIPGTKFILIGVLIHLGLDYVDLIYYHDKLYSKFSQTYVYLTSRTKNKFKV